MHQFFSVLVAVMALAAAPAGVAGDEGTGRPPLPPPEAIARLPADGGPGWNRLVFEQSPYLLQHAANPVDWYPWGEEAFEVARAQDKPVFLSIGYSTCHWCHVMEHESFEDPEVAHLMNDGFVCIKVDREERPDVDQVYMAVTQARGRGGWPMTVVMTPDKKPFFTGTYFPKNGRFGRPGMMDLLPQLISAWDDQRDRVLEMAEQAIEIVRSQGSNPAGVMPSAETLDEAYRQLEARYDPERGGFSKAPKFPIPHNLRALLRHWHRTDSDTALAMVEKTLVEMRQGGIWDHLGYGFHRYSTDVNWLVPHFEKMLYDQAALAMAYTEAYQITGKPEYERTAREILTYVLRDMTSPAGGFYSAEDADSEGEEGKFYLWQPDEVIAVLGQEEGELFNRVYDVTATGNFQDPHSGKKASIPRLKRPLREHAPELGVSEHELETQLARLRTRLFEARKERIPPLKDDKVLTDWNGLMIASFAKSARAFDEPEYAEAARRAADFVLAELRDENGRLLKRWRGGKAGLVGTLEDYAFFLWGLVEVWEAGFDVRHLEAATTIAGDLVAHFSDPDAGGFFLSADDGEILPIRAKESYDGAIPSGNSVAALALLKLARLTGDPALEVASAGVLTAYSGALMARPSIHTQMLEALSFALGPSHEIVVVGSATAPDVRTMLRALQRPFFPNKVVLLSEGDDALASIAPYTAGQTSLDGNATAYVCRDFACRAPTTQINEMLVAIGGVP